MVKSKVLFLDEIINIPNKKDKEVIPEGGTLQFSQLFNAFFKNKTNINLVKTYFKITSKKINLTKIAEDSFLFKIPKDLIDNSLREKTSLKEVQKKIDILTNHFQNLIEEQKITAIFFNGYYGLLRYALFLAAKRANIFVVIQHAGVWKKEVEHIPKNGIKSWKKRIYFGIEKSPFLYQNSYHIFLNDHSKKNLLESHNIILKNRSKTIAFPLDTSSHYSVFKKTEEKSKKISIALISRWDAIKNHSAFLRLGKFIKEKKIKNILLFSVTKKKSKIRSIFLEEYKKYIKTIKPMSNKELGLFYRKNDLILLPSHFETFGAVVGESILNGKPAIISSQTGWVDVYKKFKLEKLIINPKDSGQKIFETIKFYQENQEKFIPKFEKLQRYIIETHDPIKVFQQYEKIFTSLIKK